VWPEIDGGRFPIKRTVGEDVTVSADIFADGHDLLAGVVKYRRVPAGPPSHGTGARRDPPHVRRPGAASARPIMRARTRRRYKKSPGRKDPPGWRRRWRQPGDDSLRRARGRTAWNGHDGNSLDRFRELLA
jgi:hypothetical protein